MHIRIHNYELKYQTAGDPDGTFTLGFRRYYGKTLYIGLENAGVSSRYAQGFMVGFFMGFQKKFGSLALFADAGLFGDALWAKDNGYKQFNDFGCIINSGVTYYLF